ncbi:MAG: FAD-dependent oxidoreductase [Bacteroidota bacterium]
MKVAIIGAGPAGLTAAYQLSKESGIDLTVYEASAQVGGLSRSLELWGERVDLGPHRFFSSDRRVNELWLEVVQKDYVIIDRLTRIFYKDRYFHYPLKAFDALQKLGIFEAARCVLSYGQEKLSPTPLNGSFENWVVHRFGRRLFEIFFKTYSEKLWGITCQDLDADFAAQRIKKLSLWEAVKNAINEGRGNQHKTLVDQFAYPTHGSGMVYERMAEAIVANGGTLYLNRPVHKAIMKDGKITGLELEDGSIEEYDHVVSTMPLSLLVSRLLEAPDSIKEAAKALKFRNTILVYLEVEGAEHFPDNWLYVHSDNLEMGRITNFSNWLPNEKRAHSILTLEYWCYPEDARWSENDNSLIELAKKEIRETGLIGEAKIKQAMVYRIPKCYPVYKKGYKNQLEPIEAYLKSLPNLSVIGRYGAFKYNNQDHSILMGLFAAENIISNQKHDLWGINTDYESYQEEAIITETGLQSVN